MKKAIDVLSEKVDILEEKLSNAKSSNLAVESYKQKVISNIESTICDLNHAIKVLEEYGNENAN